MKISTAPSSTITLYNKAWTRERWLEECRSLWFFVYVILPRVRSDKFQNFGILHRYLCEYLASPSGKKWVSMFRGSYKTTVILGYLLWLFCWSVQLDLGESMVYNTASKDNASIFSQDFRDYLAEGEELRWIFDKIPAKAEHFKKNTQWRVEQGTTKFHVASLDTRQVFRHYRTIINDDLVNDKNAYSETQRADVIKQWRLQKSILTRYRKFKIGKEIDVGTPYHPKDLAGHIRRLGSYDKFIMPYALEDGRGPVDPYKKNGVLTFPEMFTWEDFQDLREEQGFSVFNTQYRLETVDEADVLCKSEWIHYWISLPGNYWRIMVVDPAGVETKHSSASGITICDHAGSGIYILHGQRYWVTPKNLIRIMESLKETYNPDEIFVEREKYSVTIADTIDHEKTRLNFSFVEPRGRAKPARIMRLRQWFETGRILLPRNQNTELEDALTLYTPGASEYEDLLDSLAYHLDKYNPPKSNVLRHENTIEKALQKDFDDELKRIAGPQRRYREDMDALF